MNDYIAQKKTLGYNEWVLHKASSFDDLKADELRRNNKARMAIAQMNTNASANEARYRALRPELADADLASARSRFDKVYAHVYPNLREAPWCFNNPLSIRCELQPTAEPPRTTTIDDAPAEE